MINTPSLLYLSGLFAGFKINFSMNLNPVTNKKLNIRSIITTLLGYKNFSDLNIQIIRPKNKVEIILTFKILITS